MVTAFRHFAPASKLCRGAVDEKFGDDGQQNRRVTIPHTDQAGKDPIQMAGVALVGLQR
jgi:hypothetical protein